MNEHMDTPVRPRTNLRLSEVLRLLQDLQGRLTELYRLFLDLQERVQRLERERGNDAE